MRIPTSVIVMSLLTAAPFGLAIRDTLTKKQPIDAADEWDDHETRSARRDREQLAQYEAEMAREAEARATKRKDRLGKLDTLFGPKPASMGALLDGLQLGAPADNFEPAATRQRLEREAQDGFIMVDFNRDSKSLRGVSVRIQGRDYDTDIDAVVNLCTTLHDKLVTAWGPSTNGAWLDESTHQRATLDENACTLTFDRYLAPSEWIASLPLDVIGKGANTYFEKFAASAGIMFEEFAEDYASWEMPGLGGGVGGTKVSALIEKGKVVGLRATVESDFDTTLAVRDALSAAFKSQPKRDDAAEAWVWKRKPATSLTQYDGSNRFILLVGRDPWE